MQTPAGWRSDPWELAQLRWWDGTNWTGHVHHLPDRTRPGRHFDPPIAFREVIKGALWLVLLPASWTLIIWLSERRVGEDAWWLLIPAVIFTGLLGGALVRPNGRWGEQLLLAVALAVIVGLSEYEIALAVSPTGCTVKGQVPPPSCDTAYGLGSGLVMLGAFVALLPFLFIGRWLATGAARRRVPVEHHGSAVEDE